MTSPLGPLKCPPFEDRGALNVLRAAAAAAADGFARAGVEPQAWLHLSALFAAVGIAGLPLLAGSLDRTRRSGWGLRLFLLFYVGFAAVAHGLRLLSGFGAYEERRIFGEGLSAAISLAIVATVVWALASLRFAALRTAK